MLTWSPWRVRLSTIRVGPGTPQRSSERRFVRPNNIFGPNPGDLKPCSRVSKIAKIGLVPFPRSDFARERRGIIRTLAISLPISSLERDFCRRRQAPQKRPRDDISARRLEIGDHRAREMAAKAAFSLADLFAWVSGDCVVGAPGLEPGTR